MGFSSKNWYQSWYQAFVQKYQYRYQYRIFQLSSISISIGIRLAAKDSISIVSVSKIQTCLVSVSYRYRKKWYRRSLILNSMHIGPAKGMQNQYKESSLLDNNRKVPYQVPPPILLVANKEYHVKLLHLECFLMFLRHIRTNKNQMKTKWLKLGAVAI